VVDRSRLAAAASACWPGAPVPGPAELSVPINLLIRYCGWARRDALIKRLWTPGTTSDGLRTPANHLRCIWLYVSLWRSSRREGLPVRVARGLSLQPNRHRHRTATSSSCNSSSCSIMHRQEALVIFSFLLAISRATRAADTVG